jgi:hypothetical protein
MLRYPKGHGPLALALLYVMRYNQGTTSISDLILARGGDNSDFAHYKFGNLLRAVRLIAAREAWRQS